MKTWLTIAAVALAFSLILPSSALPREHPQDVTGPDVGMVIAEPAGAAHS